jgi:hypothetical protein
MCDKEVLALRARCPVAGSTAPGYGSRVFCPQWTIGRLLEFDRVGIDGSSPTDDGS